MSTQKKKSEGLNSGECGGCTSKTICQKFFLFSVRNFFFIFVQVFRYIQYILLSMTVTKLQPNFTFFVTVFTSLDSEMQSLADDEFGDLYHILVRFGWGGSPKHLMFYALHPKDFKL